MCMLTLINLWFLPNLLVIRCHHIVVGGPSQRPTSQENKYNKYRAQAELQARLEFSPSNSYSLQGEPNAALLHLKWVVLEAKRQWQH